MSLDSPRVDMVSHRITSWSGAIVSVVLGACSAPSPLPSTEESLPRALMTLPEMEANLGDFVEVPGTGQASCASGRVIYLLTNDREMYAWEPDTYRSTLLGKLSCADDVNSMAIQRNGTAWIGTDYGELLKVNLADGKCESVEGFDSSATGHHVFGMSFTSDQAGGEQETLFLAVIDLVDPSALVALNPSTLEAEQVGVLGDPLSHAACELTGKADGGLFAFCPPFLPDQPTKAYWAEVNKTTGALNAYEPVPIGRVSAWHVAHWGGAYYFFTAGGVAETRIDRFVPGEGTLRLDVALPGAVVGAGVSTCAPLSAPRVR